MLILYPHGLGDIILLTPVLRELADDSVHVAVLRRFKGTQILDACPWIDGIHYVLPDPWNDTTRIGCRHWGERYAKDLGQTPVWIWHPPEMHKILYNAHALDVNLVNFQTEIWIGEEDRRRADLWLHGRIEEPYGFLHSATGMPGLSTAAAKKDFQSGLGYRWLRKQGVRDVVEVGVSYPKASMPMPVQFEIMWRAQTLCVADSVFYHAAHALNKQVDLAYFGRGKGVHRRVRPLHDAKEYVVWTMPRP